MTKGAISNFMNSLQLVEIIRPVECWKDPLIPKLFPKVIELKLSGYHSRHDKSSLPVDTYDFVGSHYLACKKDGVTGDLIPLMGVKFVTLKDCQTYHLPFPLFSVLSNSQAYKHLEVCRDIITKWDKAGRKICYVGSWTMIPEILEDRDLKGPFRDLNGAILANLCETLGVIDYFALGTPKVKSDIWLNSIGFKDMHLKDRDGRELNTFKMSSLAYTDVLVMHIHGEWTDLGLEFKARYRKLWEDRLVIAAEDKQFEEAA